VSTVLADEVAAERARGIRALLAQPLLDRRAGDDFTVVVTHADWLQRWFDDKCGWVLVVDGRHGFARLRKVPVAPDPTRAARTARATPRPLTRRRYALLCVAAAALSDTTRPQISLHDLAGRVNALSADQPDVAPFTPTRRDERVALVDALGVLSALGVISVVETRGDYSDGEAGNALYDIDDRRLGQLITAPRPPSLATCLAHLMHEDRYGPWTPPAGEHSGAGTDYGTDEVADVTEQSRTTMLSSLHRSRVLAASGAAVGSEEQARRRVRHRIMRRLLDDPVLYLDSLDATERSYLQATVASISTWAREAGMVLERRAEGWALIDPENVATDVKFPEGNDIIKHAALLLLDTLLPGRVPDGDVRHPRQTAALAVATRLRANRSWARAYQEETGATRLTDAALDLLAGLSLVRVDETGICVLPAAGRYRPQITDANTSGDDTIRNTASPDLLAGLDAATVALTDTADAQPEHDEENP